MPPKKTAQTTSNSRTGQKDVLDRPTAITAKLEKNGVSLKAQSRTIAAIDRFGGAVFGIPAELAEGVRKAIEGMNLKAALSRDIDLALLQNSAIEEDLRHLIRHMMDEEMRISNNRMAVIEQAIETLLLPAPKDSYGTGVPADDNGLEELNHDLMNVLVRHSEDATSEHLRSMWGRVLAGEIQKPGSFSASTLRVISELDAELARNFEKHYKTSHGGAIQRGHDEPLDEILIDLEDAGLIYGANAVIDQTFTPQSDQQVLIAEKSTVLRLTLAAENPKCFCTSIRLTRAGREIGSILEHDPRAALRHLAQCVAPITGAALGTPYRNQDGKLDVHFDEQIELADWQSRKPFDFLAV